MNKYFLGAAVLVAWFATQTAATTGGLPAQYLSSNQWHNLFSIHTPLANPAFMTEENYPTVRGVVSLSQNDISNLWELGYTLPLGLFQAAGVSVVAENGKSVENESFGSNGTDFTSVSNTSNSNVLAVLSYAANVWKPLSLGINLKILHQTNFGNPVNNISGDIGISYRVLTDPLLGNHIVGLMYQNPASYVKDDHLTQQLKVVYQSTYLEKLFSAYCQFDIMDIMTNATSLNRVNFQCQVGYYPLHLFEIKPYLGVSRKSLDFWGCGLGMKITRLNNGRDLGFTYQYRNDVPNGLTSAHSIYVRCDLGEHREEVHAIKMKEQLKFLPGILYNQAMTLFYKKEYWEAYQLFARIFSEFPEFFKNDKVSYYMGECLEDLNMHTVAANNYEETKALFATGEVFPLAQLGVMRTCYRQQKFEDLARQYQQIVQQSDPNLKMPDSLLNHAHYLMGQALMKQKRYKNGIEVFSKVSDTHPDYPFAQHSMALAHTLLDHSPSLAEACLVNSVINQPKTNAEQELGNRSFLLAGYLFYSQDSLGKAVCVLRMVSMESMYYAEAQLGLGWSAIRARQWNDCKQYGQKLATLRTADPLLQIEGLLLKGYAHLFIKEYNEATAVLDEAHRRMVDYETVSADSLAIENEADVFNRIHYDSLATQLVSMSRNVDGPATYSNSIDELHKTQMHIKDKLDSHVNFIDGYNRHAFFGRNAAKLKEDIEYALARASLLKNGKGSQREVEKSQKEQDKVQAQIDKTKAELQKLQENGK